MWERVDPKQVEDMKIAKSQEDIGFYVGFLGEHISITTATLLVVIVVVFRFHDNFALFLQ
jgi:hypothetical protein